MHSLFRSWSTYWLPLFSKSMHAWLKRWGRGIGGLHMCEHLDSQEKEIVFHDWIVGQNLPSLC
ncbi:unnamed protein product [Phytomonas sp. EM1]|nr:unnamed protein product [Phytomonas sp. EM1]|eukprot:CCW60619.1 unnamed protein product [Phytomonas sp. isolate EM1]